MKQKRLLLIAQVFLIVSALLSSGSLYAAAEKKAPTIVTEEIGWQLTKAKVVNAGETIAIPEGILIYGCEIDALASAIGNAPLLEGMFHMKLSIFSPTVDMPGQKAGNWYIKGSWSITDVGKDKKSDGWHSSETVEGTLLAELTFNPLVSSGYFDAIVKIPMSPAAGAWTVGNGTFSGNEKFEGTIFLNIDQWPEIASEIGGTL